MNPTKPTHDGNAQAATAETTAGGKTRIQSVARAVRLLLWTAQQPQGATAKEIAASQQLALPTTYHIVSTLVDEGLLAKDGNRRYIPGPNTALLAQVYLRGRAVPDRLLRAVRELARRTGETSYLADWGENDIRVLASVEGAQVLRVAEVASGPYEHGHARANGKLLLAHTTPELREAYLRTHPRVPLTQHTIVDAALFAAELERIRERGYSTDQEEFATGISCLAAPIRQHEHVIASLCVSAPTERYRASRSELLSALLAVAAEASHTTVAAVDGSGGFE